MYDGDTGGQFRTSGYNINSLSGWHQLVAIGSGTTTKFYIDKVLVGTSDTKSDDNIDAIGNYQAGGQNWGVMDDLRVYNRALSTDDLVCLYNYVSGRLKYWTGSAWVLKPLKYWNGTAWVEKPLRYWNGSSWSS